MIGAPVITGLYGGFNPHSRRWSGRSHEAEHEAMRSSISVRGHCTGREDLYVDRYLVFDSDAPVMSGAEVIVVIRRRAGIVVMGKILQWCASDSDWYFAAWTRPEDVGDHSRIHAFHFDPATRALRREIEVLAVFAVVDEIRWQRPTPHLPLAVTPMAPGQIEAFDRESREVVAKWTRDGYPPPRRLEFDNDPQALLLFRSMDDSLVVTAISNSIQSEAPEPATAFTAAVSPQAIEFNWTLGTFWTLNGITELYEYTSSTPFASATKIWEGRGTRKVITKTDTTTRYYWVRMRTIGGQVSQEFGASLGGSGLSAAALLSDTAHIQPNAATQVESAEDDSVSLINGGGSILSKSLSAIGISYLLQVTATLDFWRTTAGTPELYIEVIGNSTQQGVSQSAFPTATTSPGQRITLQCEVPIDPADEVSLSAAVVWTGMQPSGTAEVRNAALRCEKIKR